MKGLYKYLDVSTDHLTENDMKLLHQISNQKEPCPGCGEIIAYEYEEGFFVHVPADEPIDFGKFSKSFKKVVLKAMAIEECYLIRFDCDGIITF